MAVVFSIEDIVFQPHPTINPPPRAPGPIQYCTFRFLLYPLFATDAPFLEIVDRYTRSAYNIRFPHFLQLEGEQRIRFNGNSDRIYFDLRSLLGLELYIRNHAQLKLRRI
jgi:hypothetical protein